MDTTINGLAHELWAIAQGCAAIEDAVAPMMIELHAFAAEIQAAERERCANVAEHQAAHNGLAAGWHIAAEIRGV